MGVRTNLFGIFIVPITRILIQEVMIPTSMLFVIEVQLSLVF